MTEDDFDYLWDTRAKLNAGIVRHAAAESARKLDALHATRDDFDRRALALLPWQATTSAAMIALITGDKLPSVWSGWALVATLIAAAICNLVVLIPREYGVPGTASGSWLTTGTIHGDEAVELYLIASTTIKQRRIIDDSDASNAQKAKWLNWALGLTVAAAPIAAAAMAIQHYVYS